LGRGGGDLLTMRKEKGAEKKLNTKRREERKKTMSLCRGGRQLHLEGGKLAWRTLAKERGTVSQS